MKKDTELRHDVVTLYDPPHTKTWATVGAPKLLVIGQYSMGIEIKPRDGHALLRVFIDYELPKKNPWLGKLFGGIYAKWCVQQMMKGARDHFTNKKSKGVRYS